MDFLKQNGWICTDPSNLQFCQKVSENIYNYKEWDKGCHSDIFALVDIETLTENVFFNSSYWIEQQIDYDWLTDKEILDCINTFGYDTLDSVKEQYGGDYKMIVCECYFETIYK